MRAARRCLVSTGSVNPGAGTRSPLAIAESIELLTFRLISPTISSVAIAAITTPQMVAIVI